MGHDLIRVTIDLALLVGYAPALFLMLSFGVL
jgi:hypothetical protein